MPGRDEITFVVVDGSGCLCLGVSGGTDEVRELNRRLG